MTGIAVIAVAMLAGPFLAPPEFSWLRHSTSEQASQQLAGAWLMRAGFVGAYLGFAVGVLAQGRAQAARSPIHANKARRITH